MQGLNYGDKIQKKQFREIWDEYCNFLDLSIDEYMTIQRRLMQEQIQLWSPSGIGRKFLDRTPESIEDFRNAMPLTTYEDYADILLGKKEDMMLHYVQQTNMESANVLKKYWEEKYK